MSVGLANNGIGDTWGTVSAGHVPVSRRWRGARVLLGQRQQWGQRQLKVWWFNSSIAIVVWPGRLQRMAWRPASWWRLV